MKRTMFLVLAALVLAVAAIHSWGAPALNAEQDGKAAKAVFLDRLKPGQAVALEEKQGRYELRIFPKEIQPLSHTVIEVGQDFVVLRDFAGVTDSVIPLYSLSAVRIVRVGGK